MEIKRRVSMGHSYGIQSINYKIWEFKRKSKKQEIRKQEKQYCFIGVPEGESHMVKWKAIIKEIKEDYFFELKDSVFI